MDRDTYIRQRAYEIWEREGRPEGRAEAHWARAEREAGDQGQAVGNGDARTDGGTVVAAGLPSRATGSITEPAGRTVSTAPGAVRKIAEPAIRPPGKGRKKDAPAPTPAGVAPRGGTTAAAPAGEVRQPARSRGRFADADGSVRPTRAATEPAKGRPSGETKHTAAYHAASWSPADIQSDEPVADVAMNVPAKAARARGAGPSGRAAAGKRSAATIIRIK